MNYDLYHTFETLLQALENLEDADHYMHGELPATHFLKKRIYTVIIEESAKGPKMDWKKVKLMLDQLNIMMEPSLADQFTPAYLDTPYQKRQAV